MRSFSFILSLLFLTSVSAQEIQMSETASLEQIYGEVQEAEELLPMNELGLEFGYALYEATITAEEENPVLTVENVRDYAAVYVDGKLQGWMTEEKKAIPLQVLAGKHTLQLYAENIGRITYGPEILDNSKGLFGSITLSDTEIGNWRMIPLAVRDCAVGELTFAPQTDGGRPCFYKGTFTVEIPADTYLDVSGWGMGEVWVNGHYAGSYWEQNAQQSIQLPAETLQKGANSLTVFELKSNGKRTMRLSDKAIFNEMKEPMMKKRLIACGVCLWTAFCMLEARNEKPAVYKDAKAPTEKRVEDLLLRMTMEEKVLQLSQYVAGRNTNANNIGEEVKNIPAEIGALLYYSTSPHLRNNIQKKAMEESRLGIPVLFGHDVIHGFRTVYPISIAQACSWNPALVEKACAMAAREARLAGLDWTFSPMIDVARDPRWGRVSEGYGEDPYTNGVFAVASVKGYQGNNLADGEHIAACLKHYIGYGASEAGRDYVYTEISPQTLWDTYMLPYEMGVKAGAVTLMSGFHDISGVPASANHYTMREVLKGRWSHDGFVVSDWGSIVQLISQGAAEDLKEASEKAIMAGVDMDMMSRGYDKYLKELVGEGKVPVEIVDDAVRRILRLKFRLGLFENPYIRETTEKERFLQPEDIKIAEKLAEESFVLLKNKEKRLPLAADTKVAVIGPLGKNRWNLLGSWTAHGKDGDVVGIYDGLKLELKDLSQLLYAKGCDFDGKDESGFAEAVATAGKADVILLCLGEKRNWSGENASRASIALPKIQEKLAMELKKTGKPIVLILSNGRPLELCRLEPVCDAIVEIWQPGIAGGKPLAGILTGRINPSGKLPITFPYATGQIPIYYNRRQSARPHQGKYQDLTIEPLYEFGHGLSYTTFEYGDLKASATQLKRGDKLSVEVAVTNTGDRDGAETVYWFITDPYSTITRPVKELKYFEKQTIRAGETRTFRFEVDLLRDLGFIDGDGKRFLEKGTYYVQVKDKKVKLELID